MITLISKIKYRYLHNYMVNIYHQNNRTVTNHRFTKEVWCQLKDGNRIDVSKDVTNNTVVS